MRRHTNKPGVYAIEKVKKGRKRGGIYTFADGRKCYIAYRHLEDIYCEMGQTISDAMRDEKAAWGFDLPTILQMRAKGVKYMGVEVEETGDIFLTLTDWFTDMNKAKTARRIDRESTRYLPLRYFWRRIGPTILKAR